MSLRQRARCLALSGALCLIGGAAYLMPAAAQNANMDGQEPARVPVDRATTGADGAFRLRLPNRGRYAVVAYESYQAASAAAHDFQDAVSALVDEPTDATLASARGAWLKVRAAYMATECFRFYGGPIDGPGSASLGSAHARLDPWPIDESFIDGVMAHPDGGLIGDPKIAITRQTLRQPPGGTNPTHAATGFHVIEFLLWGPDKNPGSDQSRRATDFQAGGPHHADRRRPFLQTATKLLVEDLDELTAAWTPKKPDNYAAQFWHSIRARRWGGCCPAWRSWRTRRSRASASSARSTTASGRIPSAATASIPTTISPPTSTASRSYGPATTANPTGPGWTASCNPWTPASPWRWTGAWRLRRQPSGCSTSPSTMCSRHRRQPSWTKVARAAVAFHALARTIQDVGALLAVRVPLSSL
jgi:hypothetical protein